MKKQNTVLIILGLILAVEILGLGLFLEINFNKSLLKENKQYREDLKFAGYNEVYLTNEANYLAQFHTFRNALKNIDIEDYDRYGGNNCYDQSQVLQKTLRDMGIESTIAVVEGREHAFLMVWIEATTGDFIPPEMGYNLIEFRASKHNVICNNE